MAAFSVLLVLFPVTVNICAITARAAALTNFSTILVFGDSIVDAGNNNFIKSIARANRPPYGQDFPNHIPTGRFSNGQLITDFIASSLGIKDTVPAFLDPDLSDDDIRTGVCFASSGSGFYQLTNAELGVIPVPKQLQMFQNYITRLKGIVGEEEANRIIADALIILSAGINDFVVYYDIYTRIHQLDMSGYQESMLNIQKNFLEEIYRLGGRSLAILGVLPIGCLPIQMTSRLQHPSNRKCLEDENADSRSYHQKLVKLLSTLEESLPGSRIAFGSFYDPLIDMVDHPQNHGFVETGRGCCGTGMVELAFLCHSSTPLCSNASQYVFWDSVHPTEAAYRLVAVSLLKEIRTQFSATVHNLGA